MRIALFPLFTLLAACFYVETKADTGASDDTGTDDTGDTADTGDTGDTGDTATGPAITGAARVRFLNVTDGVHAAVTFTTAANGATTPPTIELEFTQGSAYHAISATEWTVTLSDAPGGSASASLEVTLEDGHDYTVAVMRVPGQPDRAELVLLDDASSARAAVSEGHTRLRITPARGFDGEYVGQTYYDYGTLDQSWYQACGDSGTLMLSPGESDTCEYPSTVSSVWLFSQWGIPTDEPQVGQQIEPFIQVGLGTFVDLYLTCTGACTSDDHFLLGLLEDGATATTAGCELYATVDGVGVVLDC